MWAKQSKYQDLGVWVRRSNMFMGRREKWVCEFNGRHSFGQSTQDSSLSDQQWQFRFWTLSWVASIGHGSGSCSLSPQELWQWEWLQVQPGLQKQDSILNTSRNTSTGTGSQTSHESKDQSSQVCKGREGSEAPTRGRWPRMHHCLDFNSPAWHIAINIQCSGHGICVTT